MNGVSAPGMVFLEGNGFALEFYTMTLAMVFPGQGSQSVGMLQELAASDPQVEETFQEASDVLGYDLWALVSDGPEEQLNQTCFTQPAMLAAGVATWRCWRASGGAQPTVAAGHSLGEYSALVAAGCLEFATAVSLVAYRARLMQEAVPAGEGGIAAVLGLVIVRRIRRGAQAFAATREVLEKDHQTLRELP